MAPKSAPLAEGLLPVHPGETLIVQRPATDETGESIAPGSVARVTRRAATDETGETVGPGTTGTEDWVPLSGAGTRE